jgi:hypothetical protein
MDFQPLAKQAWPECVGKTGQEAEKMIKHDCPTAKTSIIPEGSPVTFDFRLDRVHIFVNAHGVVVMPPNVG